MPKQRGLETAAVDDDVAADADADAEAVAAVAAVVAVVVGLEKMFDAYFG
jgi:hypothetical protein